MKFDSASMLRAAGKFAGCMLCSLASATGTIIAKHIVEPKVMEMQKQKEHKNPIGFRVES